MLNLYPYQDFSLSGLREGFADGHRAQILYLPTGGGKTEVAISMMAFAANKGNRVAMILDRRVLCEQTSERLEKYSISHGVMMAGHYRYRPEELIQICTAQTLEARGSFPGLKLLIVDECHSTRKSVAEFIKNNKQVKVIGLSASPFTKGLGAIYSNVVSRSTTRELVDENQLCGMRVFLAKEIDMVGAKKVAGEWSQKDATDRGIKITGDIVSEWIKKTHEIFGEPKKTIVFCSGVAHGIDLQQKFSEAGYNFISISYKDDDEFKKDAIREFSKPDSSIHGLIATDILTKGFDCILEGSRVLTNRGLVAIDKLLLSDKLWDGHSFVSHGGAIYKGICDVITYAGITATPNHRVKTKEGWLPIGYCAKEQIPIITTGIGGNAIQECENYFTRTNKDSGKSEVVKQTLLHMRMHFMWSCVRYCMAYIKKSYLVRMFKLQKIKSYSSVVDNKMQSHEIEMRGQKAQTFLQLWRSWNPIQFRFCEVCCGMDSTEYRDCEAGQKYAVGQNKQRWSLRSWKYTLGYKANAMLQYTKRWMGCNDAQIQNRPSRNTLCGQNAEKSIHDGIHSGNDNREILQEIRQTKGRVWDILNAGTRNCFTCEGLLVHNCKDVCIGVSARPFTKSFSSHVQQLGRVMRAHSDKDETGAIWLCHSGNYLRFRDQWDELYAGGVNELDDGAEKPKPEPTDIEKAKAKCPRCGAIWPPNSDICVHCGMVRVRKNEVASVPGEMVELSGSVAKKEKYDSATKERWYQELLGYAKQKGYKEGYAFWKYKDKFGIQPSWKKATATPSPEVLGWITHQNIKQAHSKKVA